VEDMDVETLFFITCDTRVASKDFEEDTTIGQYMHSVARLLVTKMVKKAMNEYMKTAKVKFNDIDNNTDEVVEEINVETLSPEPEDKNEISEGLKEAMNADVKQLSKEDMERMGMV